MFCKRKFELRIINIDKQNLYLFVAIKVKFSIERLKTDVRCNIHKKSPYKNLKQKYNEKIPNTFFFIKVNQRSFESID